MEGQQYGPALHSYVSQEGRKLMRRTILLLLMTATALLVASGVVLAQHQTIPPSHFPSRAENQTQTNYASAEILVKFKDGASKQKKEEIHKRNGGQTKEVLRGIDVELVGVSRGQEMASAAEYRKDPNVQFAEANGLYGEAATVNDPRIGEQYGYDNTGQTGGTPDADIDALDAWAGATTGSTTAPIAVLDSGIEEGHEDLTGKVTNRVNYTGSATNDDLRGHGTHIAGSIAANTNNGVGVGGTCPDCPLYNVKVLGDDGIGYYSWIANGITWAADNGAKVINMSLGSSNPSSTVESAIDYADAKGIVLVAAAGNNSSSSMFYPAAYDKVLAVAATDHNDAKASFSNYGSSWVDVAAPGVNVLSTAIDNPSTTEVERYTLMNGTSMASPHVAGVAGLVWSKTSLCSDNLCVRDRIESKAEQITGTGSDWAKGRINANNSVDTAAPETTIDSASGPSGTVNLTSASFGFSSSEAGSAFECRIDGGAWDACTSPKGYTDLPDGPHTFEVRATDPAGNTDPSPASHTWTIDTTTPAVSNAIPEPGAAQVARSTNVTATFSEDVDGVTATTFMLAKGTKEPTSESMIASGTTVSYAPATRTATLNPYGSSKTVLQRCTYYTAKVTHSVTDKAGNPANKKIWSFKTSC